MPDYFPVPFSSLQLHEFQHRGEEEEKGGHERNGPLTHLSLFSIYFNCFPVKFSEVGKVER